MSKGNRDLSDTRASLLWIVLLTFASLATSLILACAAPIAALAALAAVHLPKRDGIILALAAWAVNQAVGFLVLHYPHDQTTLLWAVGLGTAALGSALGAYGVLARFRTASTGVQLVAAYVAAFVAGKFVTLCWASVLGGIAVTLNPRYSFDQFVRNGAILLGLLLLFRILIALGVPAPRAQLAAA